MKDLDCLKGFQSKVPLSGEDMKIDEFEYIKLKESQIILDIQESEKTLKIFSLNRVSLSLIIPILNDTGIEVVSDISYFLTHKDDKIYINKLYIDIDDIEKLKRAKINLADIILKTLKGEISSSKLFKLAYLEGLSYREIFLVEAIIKYKTQLLSISSFDKDVIIDAFVKHHSITAKLIQYILNRFDPEICNESVCKTFRNDLKLLIKEVENINEDKILKRAYEIVTNIVRTNYFLNKDSISFKISTQNLSGLSGVQPLIEAFVYHKKLSGVHLRMGKVARGGLRWSSRLEDFRDEIKSLMTTQEGKNSIIVPVGAKGGFVINQESVTKEEFEKFYSIFINSILDLVDNKIDGEITRDSRVIAYDGDDPYFVVAADKGTAKMSDVANSISESRNFWLKDAFASGGSKGYSHKDLGITAKGAMRATERFFIEKGVDIYKESITVVGIGSMSGDVFGNGILLSDKFKLLGAVSSREIFIDPNPDPKISYRERERLFKLGGKWRDYDRSKISKGGGVFLRSDKEIELTLEIQKLLKTTKKTLSGEELGHRLLKLKVDLIFNGGVGTYFKASDESNIEVGDKQNEALRVDTTDIKAYAICEGGNLGLTQRARIEYAKSGGKINLDSIDNSAGVDISDHEVNLKIVLNLLLEKGIVKESERVEILRSLTDSVENSVLWTNYMQSLSISLDEIRSKNHLNRFIQTLNILENNSSFRRGDFQIPKNSEFIQTLTSEKRIVRPILATILSYSKHFLTNIILESDLIQEHFVEEYLYKYFPKSFASLHDTHIKEHPLKYDIIAMMIANKIINNCGSTFIADYELLGRKKFILKVKSYLIVNQLFGLPDIRFQIYRSDFQVDVKKQYELLLEIEKAVTFSIDWMLKHLRTKQIDSKLISDYKESLHSLIDILDGITIKKITNDERIDKFFALLDYLKFVVAAIDIEEKLAFSFQDVAKLFYIVIEKLNIIYLMNTLSKIKTSNDWEATLKSSLFEIINTSVVNVVKRILDFKRNNESISEAFENYISENDINLTEAIENIDNLKRDGDINLLKLSSVITALHTSLE